MISRIPEFVQLKTAFDFPGQRKISLKTAARRDERAYRRYVSEGTRQPAMLRRLSITAVQAALFLAARIAGAVGAAPAPACEVTARVLGIEKTRHAPRLRPSESLDYYRVRLEIRGISPGGREDSRSCDSSYLKTIQERGYQILTLKEYARKPVKKSQEVKAAISFGGDESFGGFFLSDIRILDAADPRKTPGMPAAMCFGFRPGSPDLKTAGIYSCANAAGGRIYEVSYAAEDTGSDYFDTKGGHIALCGEFSDEPPTKACREISGYSCDREKNLEPALCGRKERAYLACGCGCCGGAEPVRRCLYRSKGDDPKKLIEEDLAAGKNPACAAAGCSRGVEYVWCD